MCELNVLKDESGRPFSGRRSLGGGGGGSLPAGASDTEATVALSVFDGWGMLGGGGLVWLTMVWFMDLPLLLFFFGFQNAWIL